MPGQQHASGGMPSPGLVPLLLGSRLPQLGGFRQHLLSHGFWAWEPATAPGDPCLRVSLAAVMVWTPAGVSCKPLTGGGPASRLVPAVVELSPSRTVRTKAWRLCGLLAGACPWSRVTGTFQMAAGSTQASKGENPLAHSKSRSSEPNHKGDIVSPLPHPVSHKARVGSVEEITGRECWAVGWWRPLWEPGTCHTCLLHSPPGRCSPSGAHLSGRGSTCPSACSLCGFLTAAAVSSLLKHL